MDKILSQLPSIQKAAETLAEAAQAFYLKGWMPGTSGNLSLRVESAPLQYVITASGRDKGALKPAEDFVLVGAGGAVVESMLSPAGVKSSAETLLHERVYRQFPHVNAVYHVHTVSAAVLSRYLQDEDHCLRFSDLEMLKGLGLNTHQAAVSLPVIENSQDMVKISQEISPRLSDNVPGFILKEHGLYAWGTTPFEAKRHIEIWEYLFQFRLSEATLTGELRRAF